MALNNKSRFLLIQNLIVASILLWIFGIVMYIVEIIIVSIVAVTLSELILCLSFLYYVRKNEKSKKEEKGRTYVTGK